jgi:hypothetical protein
LPVQQAVYEPLPLPDVASDGAWSPQIDVRELPDDYIVLVDLPASTRSRSCQLGEDRLTIEGIRGDRLHAGGVPYRLERPAGTLRLSVLLPGPQDRTQIRTRIATAGSRSASQNETMLAAPTGSSESRSKQPVEVLGH